MKRNTTLILTLTLLAVLAGCSGPDAALVDAADHFVNVTVGPEYEGYVNDDPNLDPIDKSVRLENVRTFRAAVDSAKQ